MPAGARWSSCAGDWCQPCDKKVRLGFRLINVRSDNGAFQAVVRRRLPFTPLSGTGERVVRVAAGRPQQTTLLSGESRSVPAFRSPRSGSGGAGPRNHMRHSPSLRRRLLPSLADIHHRTARDCRPRPIRRLARSVIVGDSTPRLGAGAPCRPLREARRQHQGLQRPEQRSGHPDPGTRTAACSEARIVRQRSRSGSGGFQPPTQGGVGELEVPPPKSASNHCTTGG